MKSAKGIESTTTGSVIASIQLFAFVTVRVTLYVPPCVYVCVGFCSVELPPSQKFQCHDTIFTPLLTDKSVKDVSFPAQTMSAEKLASGLGLTYIGETMVSLQPIFVTTMSVTLYTPVSAYV